MKQTIAIFASLGVKLTPAGNWGIEQQAGHTLSRPHFKKKVIQPFRADGLDWKKFPRDNMAKFRLEETKYLIVDLDGETDYNLLEEFPTLVNTFKTRTTAHNKIHFYVLPPEDVKEKPLIRVVKWKNNIDILSTGIMFEGHGTSFGRKVGCYKIMEAPILRLSREEWEKLLPAIRVERAVTAKNGGYYSNTVMRKLVLAYIASKLKGGKSLTIKNRNKLFKMIAKVTPKDPKKPVELPPISYPEFNRIAFTLYMNSALDTKDSLAMLELLIVEEYRLSLKSEQTQTMLYKKIVGSLPTHKATYDLGTDDSLEERLGLIAVDGFTFLTASLGGKELFLSLDDKSLELRKIDTDTAFPSSMILKRVLRMSTPEFTDFSLQFPVVKVVNEPHKPMIYFCEKTHFDVYNIAEKTEYQKRGVLCKTLSRRNLLGKLIENYFGSMSSLYYSWLSQILFSDTPPNTILMACHPETDKQGSGTGKTMVTATIPHHFSNGAIIIEMKDIQNSWGDMKAGKTLLTMNDIGVSDDDWENVIYHMTKSSTSANLRRMSNKKFGAITNEIGSVAMAFSSNRIYNIGISDRRYWIQLPASIYEGLGKLDSATAMELNHLVEIQDIEDVYKPQFQELYNYLMYIHTLSKHKKELQTYAPMTKGRLLATQEKSYEKRIIPLIKGGKLDELAVMCSFEKRTGRLSTLSSSDRMMEILEIYTKGRKTILPIPLLQEILARVGVRTTNPKEVLDKLGLASVDITSQKLPHALTAGLNVPTSYRTEDSVLLTKE